jgi:hypothetical protein
MLWLGKREGVKEGSLCGAEAVRVMKGVSSFAGFKW